MVAAQRARCRTFRRREAHSEIAIVLLAMVNQVLGRILRSERTASLRCPIVKPQRAANAEVSVNLKTVPIRLLLGCAGTDCGYPSVRSWQIVLQKSFRLIDHKFSGL